MAKYVSKATTSITGRYGGVVYNASGPHRTIRSMAVPKSSANPSPALAHATAIQALPAYNAMPDTLNRAWELFTAWWYPARVGGFPIYHNSQTLFQQCYVNASSLGVDMPATSPPVNPPPPATVAELFVTNSAGTLTAQRITVAGSGTPGPWLLTLKPYILSGTQKPVADAGLLIAGSTGAAVIDITAATLAAFGTVPPSGSFFNATVVPLYPDWWAPWTKWVGVNFVF